MATPIDEPLHIIAGNHSQAAYLAWYMSLQQREWVYVRSEDDLRGFKGGTLLMYGGWHIRRDCSAVIHLAHIRGFTVVRIGRIAGG